MSNKENAPAGAPTPKRAKSKRVLQTANYTAKIPHLAGRSKPLVAPDPDTPTGAVRLFCQRCALDDPPIQPLDCKAALCPFHEVRGVPCDDAAALRLIGTFCEHCHLDGEPGLVEGCASATCELQQFRGGKLHRG